MKTILLASVLAMMPALSPPAGTPDYKTGWCEGWNAAYDELMQHREHWRSLLKQPKMSPDEVLDWIYSKPWIDGPSSNTAPRTLGSPPGTPQIGPGPIESADLYLMLAVKCQVPTS